MFLAVVFGGVIRMLRGMQMMPVGCVGMIRNVLMIAFYDLLCGFSTMFGGVLDGLSVMISVLF